MRLYFEYSSLARGAYKFCGGVPGNRKFYSESSENMKKVAAINDLSGFGRCSLTVALPIISSYGIQCCPLPTAVLSCHTGYETYFFDDYTDRMEKYFAEWQKLKLAFDCIYTGFLGSDRQIDIVLRFVKNFKKENTVLLVDPVMGDNGRIYSTYTHTMCEKMELLVSEADIITPNLTEACILSGSPYNKDMTEKQIAKIAEKLYSRGAKNVVITGLHRGELLGNYIYDGNGEMLLSANVPNPFSGTGDVFASVLCASVVNGVNLRSAVKKSAEFVYKAARHSYERGGDIKDGVDFEYVLALKLK